MTPVLPDVVLPPYIDSVSDKSRYPGGCCSGSGVHMYPPALSPLSPLLRQDACIPITPLCSASAALPPDDGTSCGGIHRESSLSWGSPPRSQNQTRGSPEIKIAEGPEVCPLPPQNPGSICPSTPILPEFINHCQPVIIRCSKDPSKVFKYHHRLQRSHVGLEGY